MCAKIVTLSHFEMLAAMEGSTAVVWNDQSRSELL